MLGSERPARNGESASSQLSTSPSALRLSACRAANALGPIASTRSGRTLAAMKVESSRVLPWCQCMMELSFARSAASVGKRSCHPCLAARYSRIAGLSLRTSSPSCTHGTLPPTRRCHECAGGERARRAMARPHVPDGLNSRCDAEREPILAVLPGTTSCATKGTRFCRHAHATERKGCERGTPCRVRTILFFRPRARRVRTIVDRRWTMREQELHAEDTLP
eukprot:2062094-Prymnesium_polylepis.1